METQKVLFGKYKDMTFKDLIQKDPEYALWFASILRDEKAKKYVLDNAPRQPRIGKYRINFGKYADQTYDWLLENDVEYAKWLVDKIRSKKVRTYVEKQLVEITELKYEDEYPSLGTDQFNSELHAKTTSRNSDEILNQQSENLERDDSHSCCSV